MGLGDIVKLAGAKKKIKKKKGKKGEEVDDDEEASSTATDASVVEEPSKQKTTEIVKDRFRPPPELKNESTTQSESGQSSSTVSKTETEKEKRKREKAEKKAKKKEQKKKEKEEKKSRDKSKKQEKGKGSENVFGAGPPPPSRRFLPGPRSRRVILPSDRIGAQRKIGYMSTTGMYTKALAFTNVRDEHFNKGEMDQVKKLDAEWAEAKKEEKREICTAWPPPRLYLKKKIFFTVGHYKPRKGAKPPKFPEGPKEEGKDESRYPENDINQAQPEYPVLDANDADLKSDNFSTHRLQVSNIPLNATEEDIEKVFPGGSIKLYPDPAGGQLLAVVKYKKVQSAFQAFQFGKRAQIGGKPLVVSPKLRDE